MLSHIHRSQTMRTGLQIVKEAADIEVEVDSSEKHCPWDTNFTDARCLDKDQKAWDEQIYATEDDCILMKNYSFQTYLKLSLFFVLFFT
ncbi:uncharacterized protein LOC111394475 isoform X4 [Olea europaea var. sylvestris]|uniref:uncharacterized protein LOC111394475 isoform X4 n=1 Tax=Olea europaea var. sylvestris TaxID=158386 RepID=UPI000C1D206B|nr:uncharacterized protein LOC111394475 isoform X4 [Olea europaea var. sylvestris]